MCVRTVNMLAAVTPHSCHHPMPNAGKLFRVCMNTNAAMGFVLRQEAGPQLTLDFGKYLLVASRGLTGNQYVNVVGVLDTGEPRKISSP